MNRIDLNCDLGEGGTQDASLLELVTSANVACGGHAGNEATMRETVRQARARGVAVGAHPGWEDPEHFGRRELAWEAGAVRESVRAQIERLRRVAATEGVEVTHVKPHGALYNQAARDATLARAVVEAICGANRGFWLFAPAGSELEAAGRAAGLRVAREAFVDRRYNSDRSLVGRSRPEALLEDPDEAAGQAVRLARGETIVAVDGSRIAVPAETLCIHGDTPGALVLARRVAARLEAAGVARLPVGR